MIDSEFIDYLIFALYKKNICEGEEKLNLDTRYSVWPSYCVILNWFCNLAKEFQKPKDSFNHAQNAHASEKTKGST